MDSVAQVRTLGVDDRYLHVFSGHGAGDNSRVSGVAVDNGRVDAVRIAKGHRSRIIIGNCAALSVDIVNGQVKDVLLIEHLDDVFTLVHADGQRQVFNLVKRIASGALILVRIDLAAEGGLVGLGHRIILHIVDIVLHGVVVLVDRPLGVQVIGLRDIHTGESASVKGSAGAVSLGVPANEGITGALGQIQCVVSFDRDLGVVGNGGRGLGHVGTEVAVIGDTDSRRLVAPLGVQRHIAGDLHGTVGIVRLAGAVGLGVPTQEDLGVVGEAVALDGGLGALGVLLGVGHGAGAAVGIVGHRVTGAVAHLGVQVIVHGDLGARIEGQTTIDRPAQEAVASIERELELSFQLGQLIGDGITLLDNNLANLVVVLIIHRYRVGGSHPLGVQGNVVGGHGLAGEDEGVTGALLVGVPTVKDVVRLFTGESLGGVINIRDGLLELLGDSMLIRAIAHKHDVVAVAGVIELGLVVVVLTPAPAPLCRKRLEGKTGDGVLVLVSDTIACAGRGVAVMQLIVQIARARRSGLTRQDFHIVVGCLGTPAAPGAVEACTVQRHRVDITLIRGAIICCGPGIAAIVSGPLVANVGAVLGGDTQVRVFFRRTMPTTVAVEPHRIHIALVVHLHNGRAVALDGLLGDGLGGETGVAVGRGAGRAAGSAGLGLALLVGIAVIVGVFPEVNDSVLCLRSGRPLGVQGGAGGDAVEAGGRHQILVSVPTGKGVAGLGGLIKIRGYCAIGVERRGHIAAAVGLEGEPIALFHLGIQGDVGTIDGDGLDLIGIVLVGVPAGDGFIVANGEVHVFKGDFGAVCDRLGGDDTVLVVLKVDVIAVRELGLDLDGLVFASQSGDDTEGNSLIPADEHLAVLCGHLGLQQGVVVLHDLPVDLFAIDSEHVGVVSALIRCDA